MSIESMGSKEPGPSDEVIHYAAVSEAPMVGVIACRVLALWIFSDALAGIGRIAAYLLYLIPMWRGGSASLWSVGTEGFPAVILLVFGVYCWRKAPWLAQRMTRDLPHGSAERSMKALELLPVLMMAIGVYLFTSGLPAITVFALQQLQSMRQSNLSQTVFSTVGGTSTTVIVTSFIRCALGIWLILGPGGIALFLQRHGGRWRDGDSADQRASAADSE